MTHAPHFPAARMPVQLSAAVLDDGRFVASASSAHFRIAATVAGSSIATTVSLSADTLRCSSATSDALAETPFHIPSTDTPGFAAAAIAVSVLACYRVVDSVDKLLDLDRGSWERSLPDSSSLGGDGRPLRGAFIIDSASLTGFQNSVRENSINFAEVAHFSSPSFCGSPAFSGPTKWPSPSPPPTGSTETAPFQHPRKPFTCQASAVRQC